MHDPITKAATLLKALPYIHKFSHATLMVKYSGNFMGSPDHSARNGGPRAATTS